jgi:succinoglycan biosynthesis protein ExoM
MPCQGEHIVVGICTYKRPELLGKLLEALRIQETGGLFHYSVLVVDNDFTRSAQSTVNAFKAGSAIDLNYVVEPEKNIARARNAAIENAGGEYLAFIDDDEYPSPEWLSHLFKALHEFGADGVLGPVKPQFETQPPKWVVRSRLCERESFVTGRVIGDSRYTRTGNVLFRAEIFEAGREIFDPAYGKTGGEDVDLFSRMIGKGKTFVWCDEAVAYEAVLPARLRRGYFIKRALLRGCVNSEKTRFFSVSVFKSILAVSLYSALLPFLVIPRHDLFMKYLVKDCDHLGKLLGVSGLKIIKEKNF